MRGHRQINELFLRDEAHILTFTPGNIFVVPISFYNKNISLPCRFVQYCYLFTIILSDL